jgi:hypothetical protein
MFTPDENWALLTEMDNINMQVDALRGLLEICGIPSQALSTQREDVSQFILGQSFKDRFLYQVYVPTDKLEEARELMNAPVEYDWPEDMKSEGEQTVTMTDAVEAVIDGVYGDTRVGDDAHIVPSDGDVK